MNELIEFLKAKILEYSGINVAASQHQVLIDYVEKKAFARGVSSLAFCKALNPGSEDFDQIINLITVNETYFFREEAQFDFLKKEVFPKYMGRNLTIWSCCCSTGEEPISLLALALSMNVNLTIYASDIDDGAIAFLKRGRYSSFSLRSDGQKYHKLLASFSRRQDDDIIFHPDFIERIHIFKFNLIQDGLNKLPFYEDVDILFMRNVFIYFDKENRKAVTKKLTERLKSEGLLFYSMNEIGSMDEKMIPKDLCKKNSGHVYYFVKNNPLKNGLRLTEETNRYLSEMEQSRKKEKLRKEVEKLKLHKFTEENDRLRKEKSAADSQTGKKSFDAKKFYEDICAEINRGDFSKARTIARAISGNDTKKYSYFLLGYVEYQADNRAEADSLFANVEAIAPDFWPAFFYHGMLLRDLGRVKNASTCFSKCKNLIADFGNELPYDFTLDSFSPSYISSICETFSMEGGQ